VTKITLICVQYRLHANLFATVDSNFTPSLRRSRQSGSAVEWKRAIRASATTDCVYNSLLLKYLKTNENGASSRKMPYCTLFMLQWCWTPRGIRTRFSENAVDYMITFNREW